MKSSADFVKRHALLILLIGFTVVFLSSSIKNTYQVFFIQMTESFGQTRGEFAVAASVFVLVFGISSPIVGLLIDRIGPKRTILLGLILSGVAMLGCALLDSFIAFVLLYGVVAAFGLTAMSYVPMGILVDQSFSEKHKGLAYATLTNGGAIGFMVLSPGWVFTQSYFVWQQVYLFLGILFLLPLLFLVFRYLPDDQRCAVTKVTEQPILTFSDKVKVVFSHRPFYVLMFGFMGCGVTMAFIDVHMVAHLQDLQLTQTQIGIALSLLGAAELIGGFLAGWMCGRFSKRYVITGFYLLRAVSLIVLLIMPNVMGVLLFAALFGLSYLGTVIGTSMYTLSLFGRAFKGFAFGFIWLIHQLGAFLSTQLGANAFDWYGNYQYTITATALVAIISCAISFALLPCEPKPAEMPAANTH